jgi:catechol 2,3-dioxygenase-like lactoylglutathione lyase family enzyme
MSPVTEVAVFTDDVPAAVAFYCGLVGSAPVAEWPGGAMFAAGGVTLLVHERSPTMEDGPPNEDHFAISVPDLQATCEAMKELGATVVHEPRVYPWGRSAYARDPDQYRVELIELSG